MDMFYQKSNEGYQSFGEGVKLKVLLHGKNTQINEVVVKKGETLKTHSHDYEQTGYLVSGHLRLIIGDQEVDALPGCAWSLPANIVHGAALALEDSVAVEVYSPAQIH